MIRAIDLLIAIVLLILLLPFLSIFVTIKIITDGLPIFYISKRCVAGKRLVNIYKFRTMVNDGELIGNEVAKYTKDGFESIPLTSSIYTRTGIYFEKFQIVEIPQLLNILKGDLSFVGYRPLPLKNVELLELNYGPDILRQRHSYRAGLTGYAQIIGKAKLDPYQRLMMEIKLGRDLYESGIRKSLSLYFIIFVATFFLIAFNKSIFSLDHDLKNEEV